MYALGHTPAPSHLSLVDCLFIPHPSLINCLLSSHLSLVDCLLTPHPSLIDCLLSSHLSLADCLLTSHPSLIDCLLSSHLSLVDCLLTPHPSLIDCLLSSHLSLVDCFLTPHQSNWLASLLSCISSWLSSYPSSISNWLSSFLSSISSSLSPFRLLFFFLLFFTFSYVTHAFTHWTVNSGNWLPGVGMVEPHILINLATNPQRTWGLLPTSACCWNAIPKSVYSHELDDVPCCSLRGKFWGF